MLEGGRRLTWGPGHGSHERPRLGMLGRAGRRVCGTFLALHCCPPPAERRTKVSKKTWIHPGQQEDPIASTRLRKGHHENAVGFCSRLAGYFLGLDQGVNLINCLQNPVGLVLRNPAGLSAWLYPSGKRPQTEMFFLACKWVNCKHLALSVCIFGLHMLKASTLYAISGAILKKFYSQKRSRTIRH